MGAEMQPVTPLLLALPGRDDTFPPDRDSQPLLLWRAYVGTTLILPAPNLGAVRGRPHKALSRSRRPARLCNHPFEIMVRKNRQTFSQLF
jgi:hypothetical protein